MTINKPRKYYKILDPLAKDVMEIFDQCNVRYRTSSGMSMAYERNEDLLLQYFYEDGMLILPDGYMLNELQTKHPNKTRLEIERSVETTLNKFTEMNITCISEW